MPIKSLRARWRRETFQTLPYLELFMTTMKYNFCNRCQYKMQKNRDGGGNNAYKIFTSWVEEENIPKTISYVEVFMTTRKMKNNFYIGCRYEMQKSRDGGGNNANKTFASRVEEGKIPNTISYVELFMTTMKMKNNFCDGYQHEMQKSWDGGGNNVYKIFTSWVEEGYIPNTMSYLELFMTPMKMKNNYRSFICRF